MAKGRKIYRGNLIIEELHIHLWENGRGDRGGELAVLRDLRQIAVPSPGRVLERGEERDEAPAARPAVEPAREQKVATGEDNRCPICGVAIGPTSMGCRKHYQQVKKAIREGQPIESLAEKA